MYKSVGHSLLIALLIALLASNNTLVIYKYIYKHSIYKYIYKYMNICLLRVLLFINK